MLVCLPWVFRVCGTVLGAGSKGRVLSRESAVRKGLGLGQKARWSYPLWEAPTPTYAVWGCDGLEQGLEWDVQGLPESSAEF